MVKIKATGKLVENVHSIADNSRTHSIMLDLGTASDWNDTPSASFTSASRITTDMRFFNGRLEHQPFNIPQFDIYSSQ